MSSSTLTLGTRGSRLALCQTQEVVERLQQAHPVLACSVITITTTAERRPDLPLVTMGRGIFVKELEEALLSGKVDGAVHSLKDLPSELPAGLAIGAVVERGDPRDALVNRWGCSLKDLPQGARIGTSSPRREALLREVRGDLRLLPIRGNVDTRLRKALGEEYDGVVLAAVGLQRLGLADQISEYLPLETFIPAPGQGALAVEVHADDGTTATLVASIEHPATRAATEAERAFLRALGGGCQVPVGAYGHVEGESLKLSGILAQETGDRVYRASVSGAASNPEGVGQALYHTLLEMGAGMLLRGRD